MVGGSPESICIRSVTVKMVVYLGMKLLFLFV